MSKALPCENCESEDWTFIAIDGRLLCQDCLDLLDNGYIKLDLPNG